MSESAATWSTTLHAILLHRAEPRALMLRGDSGWSLPSASFDQELWSADVRKVNAALGEALAAPVTALRYVRFQPDDVARRTQAVYVVENHSPAWHPPGNAAWIGRAALADLAPVRPDHRALIDAVLAESESGQIPDLREPWARPGWFVTAAAWLLIAQRLGWVDA